MTAKSSSDKENNSSERNNVNPSGKRLAQEFAERDFTKLLSEGYTLKIHNHGKLCLVKLEGEDALPYVNNQEFYDIELRINGKSFYAYRVLLSRESTFFRSMFETKFTEANKSKIEMILPDVETFECVLRYLYSGELESEIADANVCGLFRNADYLSLQELYDHVLSIIADKDPQQVEERLVQLELVLDVDVLAKILEKIKATATETMVKWIAVAIRQKHWNIDADFEVRLALKQLCAKFKVFDKLSPTRYAEYTGNSVYDGVTTLISSAELYEAITACPSEIHVSTRGNTSDHYSGIYSKICPNVYSHEYEDLVLAYDMQRKTWMIVGGTMYHDPPYDLSSLYIISELE